MTERILVIDDDASFLEVMAFGLQEEGYEAVKAKDGKEGLDLFLHKPFPVVVTDLKMPKLDGRQLLEKILKVAPQTLIIVITAFGDLKTAVSAMKSGAFDFLPKPCERDHFKLTVKRAVDHARLRRQVEELKDKVGSGSKTLIFNSLQMQELIDLADRVAASDATVMIEGESGTGKELLARRIHRLSTRKDGPFVPINCGAIPKDLLEDELFGHVKGAFTGAVNDRKGRFTQANGGTIFLDEIAELSPELQTRLLRVLQERVVDVVGKDEPVSVDVRVLAATNRNLEGAVQEGVFRQDLFFRLNVVPMRIPPLRERVTDVLPLAKHFLSHHSGGKEWEIPPATARRLESMSWPGNVRELDNLCQRITLVSQETILKEEYLPVLDQQNMPVRVTPTAISLPADGISLIDLEKAVILRALEINNYNQSQTAKFLQLPRHVLLYRIDKYRIQLRGQK